MESDFSCRSSPAPSIQHDPRLPLLWESDSGGRPIRIFVLVPHYARVPVREVPSTRCFHSAGLVRQCGNRDKRCPSLHPNLTRTTLSKFLLASGYHVEVAEDGKQALSLLDKYEFDLVLFDVVMPNGNGWDLVDRLSSVSPDTPVLLMTAYTPLQSSKTQSRVMPELILKPLVLTKLLTKIEQLLGQKKSP